nr:ANTAR domain-containing protein [Pseudarthrobacter enclensis]
MERHHCSQDTALQTLREESNNRNRKLRDVAAAYVAKTNTHASIHTHFDH